jgi:hypothetical protein
MDTKVKALRSLLKGSDYDTLKTSSVPLAELFGYAKVSPHSHYTNTTLPPR